MQKRLPDVKRLTRLVIKARLRTLGFLDDDLNKPIIAIANSWNEVVLGSLRLNKVAEFVKKGIIENGGMPLEFNTIGVCDGIAHGHQGSNYVLPSRDIIADSIEVMVRAHGIFDGLVCIGACDKVIPGMIMAIARLNIPSIMVTGGPLAPITRLRRAEANGKFRDFCDDKLIKMAFFNEEITDENFIQYYINTMPTCGVCTSLGTANTMACVAEALGLTLPGSSLVPDPVIQKLWFAKEAGKKIVDLVRLRLRSSKILTNEAFENAIRVLIAIGGSMNAVLHILAIARESRIPLTLDTFDRISNETPFFVDVLPNGSHHIIELLYAGGVPAILKELGDKIYGDALTVTGKTVKENITRVKILNRNVIRKIREPLSKTGGIVILRGNLAPEGAIAKPPVTGGIYEFLGEAIVFDSEEDFHRGVKDGRIREGQVIVIRYEGPKGGPGMKECHRASEVANFIGNRVAIVTDGRFSGSSTGIVVGYVSPEAWARGPIALVENGDIIEISLKKKKLQMRVDDEEIAKRAKIWRKRKKSFKSGVLLRYHKEVASAVDGAILQ